MRKVIVPLSAVVALAVVPAAEAHQVTWSSAPITTSVLGESAQGTPSSWCGTRFVCTQQFGPWDTHRWAEHTILVSGRVPRPLVQRYVQKNGRRPWVVVPVTLTETWGWTWVEYEASPSGEGFQSKYWGEGGRTFTVDTVFSARVKKTGAWRIFCCGGPGLRLWVNEYEPSELDRDLGPGETHRYPDGNPIPSGTYFYQFEVDQDASGVKMVGHVHLKKG